MLSEIQRKKLIHYFNILDHNHNGILQEEDFTGVAENTCLILGIGLESEEHLMLKKRAQRIFQRFLQDINETKNNTIAKEEWLVYFEEKVFQGENFNTLRDYITFTTKFIFDLFDQDKDGYISLDEYIDMFTIYNIDVKYSAKSFLRLDSNGDEQLSKVELYNAVTDFFISTDGEADGNWIFGNWDYK